jgi:host factor-I protein
VDVKNQSIITIPKEPMMDCSGIKKDFLKKLCDEKTNVSVFLVNGIKLHGMIEAYDGSVIMLKNGATQMIFQHAVSTVVPTVKH